MPFPFEERECLFQCLTQADIHVAQLKHNTANCEDHKTFKTYSPWNRTLPTIAKGQQIRIGPIQLIKMCTNVFISNASHSRIVGKQELNA